MNYHVFFSVSIGAHLTCDGAKTLSETLDFGGNSTMQRIDLRDNNIKTTGLGAINDAMRSNKAITRIDLDDVPRCRFTVSND
jgi:protein phosphatase 1 regulatory subunit 37